MNAPRTETIIRKRGEIRDHALYELARELEDRNLQINGLLREYLALSSIDGRAERQPLRAKLSALANGAYQPTPSGGASKPKESPNEN